MKYSILDLSLDEINTLSAVLDDAMYNVGHPYNKRTESEEAEVQYLQKLKEKVDNS